MDLDNSDYELGYESGYADGNESGYTAGKDEGYEAGKKEGYNLGYAAALADAMVVVDQSLTNWNNKLEDERNQNESIQSSMLRHPSTRIIRHF